jgi:hypothetical protein
MESALDRDYYIVQTPATAQLMTVMIQSAKKDTLYPKVSVYDSAHNLVAAEIITNGDEGRYVVQISNVAANANYYLLVEAAGRNGLYLTGDYYATVTFSEPAMQLTDVRQGTLTQTRSQEHVTLTIAENRVFHFTLEAQSADPSVVSGVRMIIFNAAGNIVFTLTAEAGQRTSGTCLLQAGTYTVRFEAGTKYGEPLPQLTYRLKETIVSDPIDPFPFDPTDPNQIPPPLSPPDFTMIINPDDYYNGQALLDPWSNPFQP